MDNAANLFKSVPAEDVFKLFHNGQPDGKKVSEMLSYKREDVAVAAGVNLNSVRFDEKMPNELKERIIEWATAINLVGGYFKDIHKTMLWFQMPNPLLGNVPPRDMIRIGRFKKLLNFIQTALDENQR